MTRIARLAAAPLVAAALLAAPLAQAQVEPVYAAPAQPARLFSQAQLDQMLAPVALYPDALLSQMLMAATYPLEIVQAARWSRGNPGLVGEDAVRAVQDRDWDPSVKSMVAFPQLLARMDEQIEWTERLGEAFLGQERQVMDTVQELRRRAHEAGNLRSSDEIVVRREVEAIYIDPPAPERVYVPYYDTRYVYGPWWWPGYEPVLWSPWSGYYYTPGYTAFGWGRPVYLGSHFFFGTFDWPRRYVRHSHHRPWYYHTHRWHNGERWRHDPARSNWRHRDRDGRGGYRGDDRRVRDRDGDGRPNWRDRDNRRDARDDGRGRGRGGDDGRRDGRSTSVTPTPQAAEAAPAPTMAAPARGTGTAISPRSSFNAPAPQPSVPAARVAPQPSMPAATTAPTPRYAPAPSAAPVRAAPAPAPAPAPVERAAPVERSAPVERPAPVREAPAREAAPTREAPSRESSPAPARGGFGRER